VKRILTDAPDLPGATGAVAKEREGASVLKAVVGNGKGGRVVVMDSITQLMPEDAWAVVVSASHGGVSSGEIALGQPLAAAFFNDAGVGKDNAGIAALEMLQREGVAAGTVSHTSARIGDGADMWSNGVISHVNQAARLLGLKPGSGLRAVLVDLVSREAFEHRPATPAP